MKKILNKLLHCKSLALPLLHVICFASMCLIGLSVEAQCTSYSIRSNSGNSTNLIKVDITTGETTDLGEIAALDGKKSVGMVNTGQEIYVLAWDPASFSPPSEVVDYSWYRLNFCGIMITAEPIHIGSVKGTVGAVTLNQFGNGAYFIGESAINTEGAFGHSFYNILFNGVMEDLGRISEPGFGSTAGSTEVYAAEFYSNRLFLTTRKNPFTFQIKELNLSFPPPQGTVWDETVVFSCSSNQITSQNGNYGMSYNPCDSRMYFIDGEICNFTEGTNLYSYNPDLEEIQLQLETSYGEIPSNRFNGLTINENLEPLTIDLGPDTSLCGPIYAFLCPEGYTDCVWTPTPEGTLNGVPVTNHPGEYCLTAQDSSTCLMASGCINVDFYEPLSIFNSIHTCTDDALLIEFPISIEGGSGVGFWGPSLGTTADNTSPSTTISGLPFGTHTLTWNDTECGTSISQTIAINEIPTAAIVISPGNPLCEGEAATAFALIGGSFSGDYVWSFCPSDEMAGNESTLPIPEDYSGGVCLDYQDSETGCAARAEVEVIREDCRCNTDPSILASSDGDCLDYDFVATTDPALTTSVVGYSWDFGDGHSATGDEVEHEYENEGSYTVTLSVMGQSIDGECCVNEVTKIVEVNCACEADADFSMVSDGCSVTLTYTGSTPSENIMSYVWDMGNGTQLFGESISYDYPEPGTYLIALTVNGYDSNECCSDNLVRTVDIICPAPEKCEGSAEILTHYLPNNENSLVYAEVELGIGTSQFGQEWYVDGVFVSSDEVFELALEEDEDYEVCLTLLLEFEGDCCEEQICITLPTVPECDEVLINTGGVYSTCDPSSLEIPLDVVDGGSGGVWSATSGFIAHPSLPNTSITQLDLGTTTLTWTDNCTQENYTTSIMVVAQTATIVSDIDFESGNPWSEWVRISQAYTNTTEIGCIEGISARLRNTGLLENVEVAINPDGNATIQFCYENLGVSGMTWDANDKLLLEGRLSGVNDPYVILAEYYGNGGGVETVSLTSITNLSQTGGLIDLRFSVNTTGGNTSNKLAFIDNITISDCVEPIIPMQENGDGGLPKASEFIQQSNIVLKPNPASDYVRLNLNNKYEGPVELILRDLNGKTLYSENLMGKDKRVGDIEINTEHLTNGTYLLSIHHNGGVETKKLVIMR